MAIRDDARTLCLCLATYEKTPGDRDRGAGEIVGLVFDGKLPSLGGRYGDVARDNHTVAVHGELIRAALEKVYAAPALARELTGQ